MHFGHAMAPSHTKGLPIQSVIQPDVLVLIGTGHPMFSQGRYAATRLVLLVASAELGTVCWAASLARDLTG